MPRFFKVVSADDRPLPPQGRHILNRMTELSEASEDGWVDAKLLIDVIEQDIANEALESIQEASVLVSYYRTKFLDRQYIEVRVEKAEPKEKAPKVKKEKKAKKSKKTVADEAFEAATDDIAA